MASNGKEVCIVRFVREEIKDFRFSHVLSLLVNLNARGRGSSTIRQDDIATPHIHTLALTWNSEADRLGVRINGRMAHSDGSVDVSSLERAESGVLDEE